MVESLTYKPYLVMRALLIGSPDEQNRLHSKSYLASVEGDIRKMRTLLSKLGFKVTVLFNEAVTFDELDD